MVVSYSISVIIVGNERGRVMHKILLVEDDEVIRQQVKKNARTVGVTKLFLSKISWKYYLFL